MLQSRRLPALRMQSLRVATVHVTRLAGWLAGIKSPHKYMCMYIGTYIYIHTHIKSTFSQNLIPP